MSFEKLTGYELSRRWFDFAFDKRECKVYHTALYLWIVELNNRLGWKTEFGLPTQDSMEGLSIGNKNTYLDTLRDLRDWGFIEIVQESKNQYQACIIKLCHVKNDTAQYTALDTALIQHNVQHQYGTGSGIGFSTDTIDKQENIKTTKQLKKEKIDFDLIFNHDVFLESSPEVILVFKKWVDYKKEAGENFKTPNSVISSFKNLKKISGENFEMAEEIINRSISNGWKGLFEIKSNSAMTVVSSTPAQSKAESLIKQNNRLNFTEDDY